jgi:hypothetical protein
MVPEMSPSSGPAGLKTAESSGDLAAKRDRTQGLGILAVAFVIALLGNWWVKSSVHQEPDTAVSSVPDKTGLLGFPEHFDPMSAYERAHDLSVREWLYGIAIKGLRRNGTLDFSRGGAARFVFGSRRGDGPQPPVAPGTRRYQDHCGRQEVVIDGAGIHAGIDDPDHDCHGLSRWLPEPSCSLEQIWKFAADKGAPQDSVAQIEYFYAKGGPAWRFSINNTEHEYVLYGDCTQELKGKDAEGKIP